MPSFVNRLKGMVGINKATSSNGAAVNFFRPTEPDFLTRGISDIAKLPTIPFIGFRFCFDLYNYSDLLRTIVRAITHETFRNGMVIAKNFAMKCMICGAEYSTFVQNCRTCGSNKLREPSPKEHDFLKKWMHDVNFNDQSLVDVLKELDTDLNIIDNAFIAVVKKYYFDGSELTGAKAVEVLRATPEKCNFVMDRDGRFGRADDGRLVLFCLEHRDQYKLVKEEDMGRDPKLALCQQCQKKMFPAYYRIAKGGTKYVYFTNGEMLHFKKFSSGIGYGLPPVFSVWQKIMILMKQDFFILTAYHLERPPKGLLILKGNRESIDKAWRRLQEEARMNPHMIYPLIIEGGKDVRNVMEFLDLTLTSRDIDFTGFREELRRTIGALWGVMPIFSGDTAGGVGLANEGLQILVTNRAVEVEQEIYNEKVLPWLCTQIGVKDWTIRLLPNEGRDIVARLQREQMRIQNAAAMASLGYEPRAMVTEDGIDFEFTEPATGEEVPSKLTMTYRPRSLRRMQRFEGEPIHGRPRMEQQRFEGEETGIRQPKVVGQIGEGGQIVPASPTPEVSEKAGEASDLTKEGVGWFTYTDDDDWEVLKAGWSRAVKDYGDARIGALLQTDFWRKYSGVTDRTSRRINGIIIKNVGFRNYNKDAIVDEVVRLTGIDRNQADLIVRTEMSNLAQKAREIAYRDRTYVTKFRWETAKDQRSCEKCEALETLTRKGVDLETLKALVEKMGEGSAREWVLHPGCRCKFVRAYGKKRKWE